jgi:hypothetical protein
VVIFHFSVPISCGFKSSEANFISSRRVANNYGDFASGTLTFNQRFNLLVIKNIERIRPGNELLSRHHEPEGLLDQR